MAPAAGEEVRLVGLTMADTTEGLCPHASSNVAGYFFNNYSSVA